MIFKKYNAQVCEIHFWVNRASVCYKGLLLIGLIELDLNGKTKIIICNICISEENESF